MLVRRVSDLQSADERECKYLTTVGDLGELVLEEVDKTDYLPASS